MIRYLRRKDINDKKWDALIANHPAGLPYGYTWYLDAVCEHWRAFVLNDYEAVMPLPVGKNFMFDYVYQPNFCQQLGVFALDKNEQLFEKFYSHLKKEFWFFHIQQNPFFPELSASLKCKTKQNYIIPLNQSYEAIAKKYNENTRRSINRAIKQNLKFDLDVMSEKRFLEIYLTNTERPDKLRVKKIMERLTKNDAIYLASVKSEHLEDFAADIFIKTDKRIIHLIPVTSEKGRKSGAMHFLIDNMIKLHQNTDRIIDFEGSSIDSIAQFYKSFGAEDEKMWEFRKWI